MQKGSGSEVQRLRGSELLGPFAASTPTPIATAALSPARRVMATLSHGDQKRLASMKFAPILKEKVDLNLVKIEVIQKYVPSHNLPRFSGAQKLTIALGTSRILFQSIFLMRFWSKHLLRA